MMTETTTATTEQRDRVVGGLVLVGLGVFFLVARFFSPGLLVLPVLALVFAAAGVASRKAGWFIPAGILGGIGLGAALIESLALGETQEGGVFLLAFAAGWALIPLLSSLFAHEPMRWALIPSGIMALIGGLVLVGDAGAATLALLFGALGWIWPLALVAGGAALILRRRPQ